MKFIQYASIILGAVILFLAGCSFEEDLAGSQDPLYPVTALKAASIDSNTILLTWIPSPNDSSPLFQNYRLDWTYYNSIDSALVKPDSAVLPRGTSSYRVTGLVSGVEYLFTLYMYPLELATRTYVSVRWAPAVDYGAITLPSQTVLALIDTTKNPSGPSVIALDNVNAQAFGDLYIENDLTLRSTSVKGSAWRRTLFSTERITAPTVPVPMVLFPTIDSFTDTVVSVQPQTVYFCKTQDGHYARLYVKDIPPTAGLEVLVDLEISYQARQNLPYAKISGE